MRREDIIFWGYLLALFIFAVIFWHNKVPWDPCAYRLTGMRLLGADTYYEPLRAPIPSLLYAILGFYGYFAFVLVLFGVSVYVFTRRRGFSPLLFITLFVPALSWPYFVETGAELLSFSFLLLAAAYSEAVYAGLLFALAFLSRYVFLIFVPFFLPWKRYFGDRRLLIFHLAGFIAPILIWSAWQLFVYGHPLASYVDFLFVNSYLNPTSLKLPRFDKLFESTLPTALLALPGLDLFTAAMLVVALIVAAAAFVQRTRFYIPALLPLSLAAHRWMNRRFGIALAVANVVVAFLFVYPLFSWGSRTLYEAAVSAMDSNCVYVSNVWVPLTCLGGYAVPPPPGAENNIELVPEYVRTIRSGYRAVVFRGVGFPAYMEDLNLYREYNIPVRDYGRFFIAGDGCVQPKNVWERSRDLYSARLDLMLSRWIWKR